MLFISFQADAAFQTKTVNTAADKHSIQKMGAIGMNKTRSHHKQARAAFIIGLLECAIGVVVILAQII